jgi:hypothetical protein
MIPNASAAIPNGLTRRLVSTGTWETVLGEGELSGTGEPGNGVWGTYNLVSNPQCGHATASPARMASNSMCPLQYWQKHFTNRGAETCMAFRVLASVEGVKPGNVAGKRQKLR